MGLLTSFHILFDLPKEDIGNSNQSEGEREDRKNIYPGRLSLKERSTLSQASNHLSFQVFRVSCLPHYMYCTVPTLSYLPQFDLGGRGGIVYCIPIEPDECPRVTKASQSVSLSPIIKQILILTKLVSELRDSITPSSYHCDHGLDSGTLQLDYIHVPTYPC